MLGSITIEFDEGIQSLDALHAASYRLLNVASCQIKRSGGKIVCHLAAKDGSDVDSEELRTRFIDFVIDETVRERLADRVAPVRNLILSLAFGALAAEPKKG